MIISISLKKVDFFIYKPFLLFAIFQLLNEEIINNPLTAIFNFLIILQLPIMGIFILRYNQTTLKKILIFFSSLFILSFIPYYLGFISSLGSGYDLTPYGGFSGLVGPFQNAHGASIATAMSLIIIVFFWFEGSFKRSYLLALFLIGIFFLLNIFVRTGFSIFIIGSFPILFYFGRRRTKSFMKVGFLIFILAALVSTLVLKNEMLVNRIIGESKYGKENSIETIGSSRGFIYLTSFLLYIEANPIQKVIGMGKDEQVNRMDKILWMKIGSHDAFLEILLVNGFIGLIIFLIYLYNIFKFIKNKPKTNFRVLAFALFVGYLIMCFVQGYEWLYANLMLMLSISYLYKNNPLNEIKNYKFHG
jgi:MFS family permease